MWQDLRSLRLQPAHGRKWMEDSAKWRAELGVLPSYHPYTSSLDQTRAGFGPIGCKRTLDLLDCSVLSSAKRARTTVKTAAEKHLAESLLDVSQSHCRRPLPAPGAPNRCLTTRSQLFWFQQQRLLCASEHLLLQGYTLPFAILEGRDKVSQSDLREIAGEGDCFALPCNCSLGTEAHCQLSMKIGKLLMYRHQCLLLGAARLSRPDSPPPVASGPGSLSTCVKSASVSWNIHVCSPCTHDFIESRLESRG